MRTSRPKAFDMSFWNGWPFIHVELEFLIRPVSGMIVPGIATPTVPVFFSDASAPRTRSHSDLTVFM